MELTKPMLKVLRAAIAWRESKLLPWEEYADTAGMIRRRRRDVSDWLQKLEDAIDILPPTLRRELTKGKVTV